MRRGRPCDTGGSPRAAHPDAFSQVRGQIRALAGCRHRSAALELRRPPRPRAGKAYREDAVGGAGRYKPGRESKKEVGELLRGFDSTPYGSGDGAGTRGGFGQRPGRRRAGSPRADPAVRTSRERQWGRGTDDPWSPRPAAEARLLIPPDLGGTPRGRETTRVPYQGGEGLGWPRLEVRPRGSRKRFAGSGLAHRLSMHAPSRRLATQRPWPALPRTEPPLARPRSCEILAPAVQEVRLRLGSQRSYQDDALAPLACFGSVGFP